MGIRVGITIAITAAFISTGCKLQTGLAQEKKEWAWAFKSRVTYSCMCELTNNRLQDILKESNDISFMGEADVLGVYFTKFADSIGRSYGSKIAPVFPDDSEFAGRKSIFTSCLALYDSEDINTIVETEYKKLKK